jgi:hypothetical protein
MMASVRKPRSHYGFIDRKFVISTREAQFGDSPSCVLLCGRSRNVEFMPTWNLSNTTAAANPPRLVSAFANPRRLRT